MPLFTLTTAALHERDRGNSIHAAFGWSALLPAALVRRFAAPLPSARLGLRKSRIWAVREQLAVPLWRGSPVGGRDHQPDKLFDITKKRRLLGVAEGNGYPVRAGARGAANPVHIGLWHVGQIEVHHMADAIYIDPARGDVGRDQCADAALAERGECALALVLRSIAVDRFRGDPDLGEAAHNSVGAVLGAGEHERTFDRLVPQEDLRA